MLSATTKPDKARTATKAPKVTFDSTRHRNRFSPSFGAGILPPTRWTGQHAYSPFTADDLAWAEEMFLLHRADEIDAEEQAYNDMLDQMALESAMLDRYTRGHVI